MPKSLRLLPDRKPETSHRVPQRGNRNAMRSGRVTSRATCQTISRPWRRRESHSCGSARRKGWRTAQTGSVCGRDGAGESSSSPAREGRRRNKVSAPFRSCPTQRGCDLGPAEAAPVPLALLRDHHWPTKVFGHPLSQRWMRPNQNVRAGGAPPRGSLLTGLDGAAGSRGVEGIHVVDRSASRVLYAMSP
jgi:hypothetical protein